ncbi:hypothetical protein Zmor_023151 [Zophobas morio]|uniref:DUF4795 domain-containing protein n=1 Tax=Zophobas morio TaxID=2755281 RepID=A0AA38M6S8_9CUCU|nr:hypothetical protein Zmor_023151 [Zophobas morio]
MVDLSINESVINFQILQVLLHVIIQQLTLNDLAVEFRGPDSDRVQAIIATNKTTTKVYPEYTVIGGKDKKKSTGNKKKISLQDITKVKQSEEKKEKELRVIERRKDSREDPDPNPLPLKSPQGSLVGVNTVVLIDSKSALPQYTVALSKTAFDGVLNELDNLKEEIKELRELPSNFGLIQSTRDSTGPIVDMYQNLRLAKRMDATEITIQKLGSLVEDLARSELGADVQQRVQEVKMSIDQSSFASDRKGSVFGNLETRVAHLETSVKELKKTGVVAAPVDHTRAETASVAKGETASVARGETASVARGETASVVKSETASIAKSETASVARSEVKSEGRGTVQGSVAPETPSRKSTAKSDVIKVLSPQEPFTSVVENVELSELTPTDAVAMIQEEFHNLSKWMISSIKEIEQSKVTGEAEGGEVSTAVVEKKFKQYAQELSDMNDLYNNQIKLLNEQFASVQDDINDVYTKLEVVLPGGDSTGVGAETTADLASKLVLLEKEIITISEQAQNLVEGRDERDKQTQAIMEQLDVLKIVKANREDLEDALGEKADACMINRKVSHDQFDAACDDLSKGIEEALNKLEEQAEMWQQALDSIQKEVGNKLDKMEVDPLRDFVNSKLKALQEKFKSLTALKREQEAAGTKTKLLRNVNCISCDKDVVMRREMDQSLKPKAYAMPPSRNMAPYLAYELDQLRKQQKCVPGSKNLNFIETALKTRGQKEKDHICNRYCGGSHTVTTPQQRVTRLGHFLEQWGPEISPLQDEYIKGIDNHMYKSRDENLYKKTNKREGQQGRISKGAAQPESDKPQQDRSTLINAEAQGAIASEEESKAMGPDKQVNNIGAVPVDPQQIQLRAFQTQ